MWVLGAAYAARALCAHRGDAAVRHALGVGDGIVCLAAPRRDRTELLDTGRGDLLPIRRADGPLAKLKVRVAIGANGSAAHAALLVGRQVALLNQALLVK